MNKRAEPSNARDIRPRHGEVAPHQFLVGGHVAKARSTLSLQFRMYGNLRAALASHSSLRCTLRSSACIIDQFHYSAFEVSSVHSIFDTEGEDRTHLNMLVSFRLGLALIGVELAQVSLACKTKKTKHN